jgi:uncharacterized DUF497 family protein
MIIPGDIEGFQWDPANREKNWERHRVAWQECEEVFLNFPLFTYPDPKHSTKEVRYIGYGQTNSARLLFVVFTIRGSYLRVVSARDMNRKERKLYHEKSQEASKF